MVTSSVITLRIYISLPRHVAECLWVLDALRQPLFLLSYTGKAIDTDTQENFRFWLCHKNSVDRTTKANDSSTTYFWGTE